MAVTISPFMLRFALTIFLSAFLLFLVQPLIGKFILPWFGGGAGVWNACLLFFQVMLLAGYAYAHAINRLASPRGQIIIHSLVMLVSLAFLPIIPDGAVWKPRPEHEPVGRIVLLLLACIGGPYLALSATGPLLQAWFARSFPGRSPYRLYALSNAGSLLALLGYPTIIEPLLARSQQAMVWSGGYVLYVLLCGACAVYLWRNPLANVAASGDRREAASGRVTMFQRIMWIVLPACASILLLSFTARLSEEVAPVPMLWVIPLAVYLLTFIIAFEWPRLYHRAVGVTGIIVAYTIVVLFGRYVNQGLMIQVAGSMLALFLVCLACHGELYRLRPGSAHLTGYYLAIAAGGALGGAFVAIISPLLFTFNFEFYLGLFGAFVAVMACLLRQKDSMFYCGAHWLGLIAITGLAAVAAILMWHLHLDIHRTTIYRSRNFYGTLTINERQVAGRPLAYSLQHGRIIHGAQFQGDPQWLRWPTTYFGYNSGVGIVLLNLPKQEPRKIGLVGLGVGTLATYGRKGDTLRFYEINPTVIELAKHPFAYLSGSPANVDEPVLGDARLSLEREETPQGFDVLVLDAFSGDAIPMHLLTVEAFEIYRRHLNPDGVILVNISNTFVSLDLVLVRWAREVGWEPRLFTSEDDRPNAILECTWMLLTANRELLENEKVKTWGHKPRPTIRQVRLWTDDHTNLFEILK